MLISLKTKLLINMPEVKIFDNNAFEFLENYINNASPSGFEASGQKIWLDYIKNFVDDYMVDNYGSVAGIINPNSSYKVVIEAHADEISWFVNYISDEGFIYVKKIGGADHQIPPSKRAFIHTKEEKVPAVFGWPAIHARNSGKEEAPAVKNLFMDCGCTSKEEVEKLGVHVGCPVTFDDPLTVLNDKFITGRALDNRIGGFMTAQIARLIHQNQDHLPFGLYIVNAVQEEVGLRGAQMITEQIQPNAAIITDVCHDTHTPRMDKHTQGDNKSGSGPVLTYGPAIQYHLLDLIIQTAQANDIPFQRRTTSRGTGTDTDSFAYSNGGVPSALISLPIRYMHTTVEMAQKEDVKKVVELIHQTLLNIQNGHDFRYFH